VSYAQLYTTPILNQTAHLVQEIAAVAKEASNTAETLAKLRTLLRLVRDELKLAAKLLVVGRQPLYELQQLNVCEHILEIHAQTIPSFLSHVSFCDKMLLCERFSQIA